MMEIQIGKSFDQDLLESVWKAHNILRTLLLNNEQPRVNTVPSKLQHCCISCFHHD